MNRIRAFLVLCVAAVLSVAMAQAQQPPKPAPELEKLKALEGTWDASLKFGDMESKGTVTYKMGVGGMWLVGDFEIDFGGQKFQSKGLDGYDANKKKYVSVWVDAMGGSPLLWEGTYDKAGKVLTMTGEGAGMDGTLTKMKTVTEMKDKDTIFFKMYTVGKDGKDQEMMTITYKRKK